MSLHIDGVDLRNERGEKVGCVVVGPIRNGPHGSLVVDLKLDVLPEMEITSLPKEISVGCHLQRAFTAEEILYNDVDLRALRNERLARGRMAENVARTVLALVDMGYEPRQIDWLMGGCHA